ncbi:MAG TPA: glycosyltransferase [Candidatus Dormibacteraeota bacterium]|nr:glycosyltransferase [Candidatus Dormibacteraeota bacterium]
MAAGAAAVRALFVVTPGHGHFYAVAPLALGLQARGHHVRVATSRGFCATVAAAGLRPVPAGMDWLESDPDRTFPQFAGLDPVRRAHALGRVFDYFAPRAIVPDLRALIAGWGPDVVVLEPGALGGQLAAELHGLPFAMAHGSIPTPRLLATLPGDEAGLLAVREALAGPRSRGGLRRELGLPDAEADPWLFLDMVPPSLHLLTAAHVRRRAHPLRPVHDDPPPDDAEDWSWLDSPAAQPPVVHVSLGTVFHRAPDVLRAVVRGLAGVRCTLVVALGDVPAAELGPVPTGTRLVRWAPHRRLLPRCDLFVTHGGTGALMKSLACGVPMLVLPQGGNQFVSAVRVHSTGAGRHLQPAEVTPEAVAREARRVLEDPVYRLNAARLRAEIEAMPPLECGLDLLERLARERQPLEAEEAPPLLL